MGSRCVVRTQAIIGSMVPCWFQIVGLFGSTWLVHDGINKGLFYTMQKDGSHKYEVLDRTTLGLEATAAILLLLCSISCCVTAWVYGPDRYDDISNDEDSKFYLCNCVWFYCNIGFYIVADILILSGCWIFGTTHPMEHVGSSFYFCLVSFLLILLMIFIFIFDQLCKSKRDDGVFQTLLRKAYEDALSIF